MPYCSRCGVEVHAEAVKCPLCNSPIQKFPDDPSPGRVFPEDELVLQRKPRLSRKERLQLAAVISAFGMLVPILITVTVDFMSNGTVSWSLYPLVLLTSCLFIVLTALFTGRHPSRLIWTMFVILIVTLETMVALSLLPGAAGNIGDPILLFAALCSQASVTASLKSRKRGSNVAAFILIALGLFCLLTDLWLSYKLTGGLRAGWSLIVLAATQPITLILLFLHYRKRGSNGILKKYFHI
ncbi:MAG: hypothetical protein PQJ58_14865 [Spirochaetales bacterium]|nr:hypothetical protein [Spirochaetales bacterium]